MIPASLVHLDKLETLVVLLPMGLILSTVVVVICIWREWDGLNLGVLLLL